MKVVRKISDKLIVYAAVPDFEEGKGIDNAISINRVFKESDLEEVEVTSEVYNAYILLKVPFWDSQSETYVESALIYKNIVVTTKTEVDAVTRQEIAKLDEEKAKTLCIKAILSSQSTPQEWIDFVAARDALVAEGDAFCIAHSLT